MTTDARFTATFSANCAHQLFITQDALNPDNNMLAGALDDHHSRAIAFVDAGLLRASPDLASRLQHYFQHHRGRLPQLVGVEQVRGGESVKNDPSHWLRTAAQIDRAGIDRHSYVLAVGGGAALDVVGFAAATVHRGVRLVRLPTTTLAQADSGVGVKCGINFAGKKNLLGAFTVPHAVINDPTLLRTLDDADWRAGFAEAMKVAIIKDAALFQRIAANAPAIVRRDEAVAFPVIARCAELHFRHVTEHGDPFETGSARPLDMGHWSAHKLEAMTGFQLSHGHAVAVGLAIDATYAQLVGLMNAEDAAAIHRTLVALGFELSHPALQDVETLLGGLEEFREHLGGRLTLILPAGIGRTATVHHVERAAMIEAIAHVHGGRAREPAITTRSAPPLVPRSVMPA